MKLYIIAAEASADLHTSQLIKYLRSNFKDLQTRGWGGNLMKQEGHQLDVHLKDAGFMGFAEVILNLPKILSYFRITKKAISDFHPDAVILVDYPGFNLRMAKWCKLQGHKVIYYIAPQVWAWKEKRVNLLKQYVDLLLPILPFEEPYFRSHGIHAFYFGHPLAERIRDFTPHEETLKFLEIHNKKILLLIPGSRKQEIKTMLPVYLKAAIDFQNFLIIIAGMGHHAALYQKILGTSYNEVHIIYDQTWTLLSKAHIAIVTSGTATLETAIFGVPQVVCYKGGWLSYQIARRLVKIKFISLVNLIAHRKIISELIQNKMTYQNIRIEIQKISMDEEYLNIQNEYKIINKLLHQDNVTKKLAEKITEFITAPN